MPKSQKKYPPTEESKSVLSVFFQDYYDKRIELMNTKAQDYELIFDLPFVLFWFSILDFYGGIYSIGKGNASSFTPDGILQIARPESFNEFVNRYFPPKYKKYSSILYSVFRCGVVHQISPRMAGLVWEPDNEALIYFTVNKSNPDNIVGFLNFYLFQKLTYNAFQNFKKEIEDNLNPSISENIYKTLLKVPDGLHDKQILLREYRHLKSMKKIKIFEIETND